MQIKQMLDRIAHLEFVNDQIAAELHEVDVLLRQIGFSDGLKSMKAAAREIYHQENSNSYDDNDEDL
jgi:hypothetical protein